MFIDNLQAHRQLKKKKHSTNLIISKSEAITEPSIMVAEAGKDSDKVKDQGKDKAKGQDSEKK